MRPSLVMGLAILQIFTVHAVGGIVGTLLTGIFAQASVTDFDGITVIPGGWLDRHFIQLGHQAAGAVAGFSWSLVVTVGSPPSPLSPSVLRLSALTLGLCETVSHSVVHGPHGLPIASHSRRRSKGRPGQI